MLPYSCIIVSGVYSNVKLLEFTPEMKTLA
jgi:hypothetical protein